MRRRGRYNSASESKRKKESYDAAKVSERNKKYWEKNKSELKKKMLARNIQEIQEVCQKSMEAFGYVSMVNITRDQEDEDFLPFRPLYETNLNTVRRIFNQPPANTMSHP